MRLTPAPPLRFFPAPLLRCLAASLLLLVVTPPLRAQDSGEPRRPTQAELDRATDLQEQAFKAFGTQNYSLAENKLREQLALDPSNFVIYYNLACARSLQKDGPGAVGLLKQAVEHGMTDLGKMKADPDLAAARAEPEFQQIAVNWGKILEAHRDANIAIARRFFKGPRYTETRDDALRITYLAATDPKSGEQAREDISRLAKWGYENVFPDLADPEKSRTDAWVVVVLPTPEDFKRWSIASFGPDAVSGTSQIGGLYSHDSKRLVAMDLGGTLRHEFFHVLHWRSCTRLGQDHAPWIQEGLCSLVEDYEVRGSGDSATLEPVPSWRTNISLRLLRGGSLMPIRQLVRMDREKFVGTRPLATYAQARTLFLYLWQTGKLKEWYQAYTDHYAEDATGEKAFEIVYGKPIAEVDRAYRAWVRTLPEVAEQARPGAAGIGADVEQGSGDGPVIVELPRRSPARQAGLRIGDVITAIDGQPTRDMNELVRVLGEHEAGDEVEVSYRRRDAHATVRVRLIVQ
ncbi:MAG: PDZ domain-containing protein [Phycisphaerales bacterium]|nr:PDZ domain-containing protein [Phycisphaerales bacterium]